LGAFGGDTGLELCEGVAWMLEKKVGRKILGLSKGEIRSVLGGSGYLGIRG